MHTRGCAQRARRRRRPPAATRRKASDLAPRSLVILPPYALVWVAGRLWLLDVRGRRAPFGLCTDGLRVCLCVSVFDCVSCVCVSCVCVSVVCVRDRDSVGTGNRVDASLKIQKHRRDSHVVRFTFRLWPDHTLTYICMPRFVQSIVANS